MEFLGRMMDSFSTAGQDVAKKAKNATESVKLNNQMKANERMIKKINLSGGGICFENQGKECGEYDELFQEINRLRLENRQIQDEIQEMTMERICPQCGFGNGREVNFCIRCGTSLRNVNLEADASAPVTYGKTCKNCGAVNEQETLFCVECGTRLKSHSQKETNRKTEEFVHSMRRDMMWGEPGYFGYQILFWLY